MRLFEVFSNRSERGCAVFACLMFGIFPVFLVPGLFFTLNIAKYCFFLIAAFLLLLYYLLFFKPTDGAREKRQMTFSIVDWANLSLCAVSLLSGLISPFFPDTVNGAYGRFNGMLTMLAYTVVYFVITRYGRWSTPFFYLFAASSALVFLLGILNFFQVDPLGAYQLVRTDQKALFLSTIGNRNFFSAYICIALPIFMTLFCVSTVRWKTVIWGFMVVLGESALFIGNSESGFVGLYMVFLILPLFLFCSYFTCRRYFFVIFTFFVAAQFLQFLIILFPNTLYPLSGISAFFVYHIAAKVMTGIFAILSLIFYLFPVQKRLALCYIKYIWVVVLLFLICAFLVLLLYFSVINRQIPLGGLDEYLRFSPEWGSNRGSVWIALLTVFVSFSPAQILIGSGPDTIYQVLSQAYYLEMKNGVLLSFDSAHNEYLQYLITTGIFGFLSYCVFIGMLLFWALRRGKNSNVLLSMAMAIVCYAIQGIFNISMISVTPLFILILAFVGADYYDYSKSKINNLNCNIK